MSDPTIMIIISMLMIMMSLIMILLVQSTILLNKIINAEEKQPKLVDKQQIIGYQQSSLEKEPVKKFDTLKVPDLDPFSIAPNLKKPPKSAGGFGNKTDQNDP